MEQGRLPQAIPVSESGLSENPLAEEIVEVKLDNVKNVVNGVRGQVEEPSIKHSRLFIV